MKIYNTHALTRNQRFQNALMYGIPTAVVIGIVFGLLLSIIPINFDIMFIAVGYAIGYVIRTKGRGVQVKFSVLGAVLCFISLFMADCISIFGLFGLFSPVAWLITLNSYVSFTGLWSIIGILFRLAAIYMAYDQSRIV